MATKCRSKDESFGSSSYLAAQEGDHFQRRRNEHNEPKAENAQGRYSVCCILVVCRFFVVVVVFGSLNAKRASLTFFPFPVEGLGFGHLVHAHLFPDEPDGHNIWNLVLELPCHAHSGVFMEALFDEEDLGENRTFLSFRTGHPMRQRLSKFSKRRHIHCCCLRHVKQDWE